MSPKVAGRPPAPLDPINWLKLAVKIASSGNGPPVVAKAASANSGVTVTAQEGSPATIEFGGAAKAAAKGVKSPVSVTLQVATNEMGWSGRKLQDATLTLNPKAGESSTAIAQSFADRINKQFGSEFSASVKPGTSVLVIERKYTPPAEK